MEDSTITIDELKLPTLDHACMGCLEILTSKPYLVFRCHSHSICVDCWYLNWREREKQECDFCMRMALSGNAEEDDDALNSNDLTRVDSDRSSGLDSIDRYPSDISSSIDENNISGASATSLNTKELLSTAKISENWFTPEAYEIEETLTATGPTSSDGEVEVNKNAMDGVHSHLSMVTGLEFTKSVSFQDKMACVWETAKDYIIAIAARDKPYISMVTTDGKILSSHYVPDAKDVISGLMLHKTLTAVVICDSSHVYHVYVVDLKYSYWSWYVSVVKKLKIDNPRRLANYTEYTFAVLCSSPARIEIYEKKTYKHLNTISLMQSPSAFYSLEELKSSGSRLKITQLKEEMEKFPIDCGTDDLC